MSTEIDEIVKGRDKIKKSKPKFMKIIGGLLFIYGCIAIAYAHFRDSDSVTTSGQFLVSVGLFWLILYFGTKQSKVNLELIDRIRGIEDKSKNSDP